MRILGEGGVPVGKNFDTRDLFHDEHLNERGFVHVCRADLGGARSIRSQGEAR